jgi:hypothetical protein
MTSRLFLVTAVAQAAGIVVAAFIVNSLGYRDHTIVFVVGAVLGTQASAYARREERPIRLSISALVGLEVAVGTVLFSLALKALFGWIPFPELTVPISAVAAFMFPVLLSRSLIGHFQSEGPRSNNRAA